jgi:enoyl-CoA hydratase/carnithine racemase
VKLGLLPGAGGTQRLPKVVGIQTALTMATTGSNVRPAKALKSGLVNEVVDPFALEHAAVSVGASPYHTRCTILAVPYSPWRIPSLSPHLPLRVWYAVD